MQLVIRVDLDKAKEQLPEIFRLIGDCAGTEETMEEPVIDASGRIFDKRSRIIGEWEITENSEREDRPHPLEPAYRAVARAQYALPGKIEVDRFARVSMTDDGGYVQGWLFIPRNAVTGSAEVASAKKPPQSVFPIRGAETKAS